MDPISLKAYKIFIEELEKQRNVIESLIDRKKGFTPKESEDLRILFHRIKGGGGFFGLTELSEKAGVLEEKILEGNCNPDKIQVLIQEFISQLKLIQSAP